MSFEDSEKTSRVTLQQHYNFVMNQVVSITYDLWHIIFMKILLIEDNQRTQEWVTQGLSEAGYVIYNENHPHSALGYRSPREYRRQRVTLT